MKSIVLESHHLPPEGCGRHLCDLIRERSHEALLCRSLIRTQKELREGRYDLVVIHHNGFEQIDSLKKDFPDIKYAGYSTNLAGDLKPGTIGFAFREKMQEKYDYILNDQYSSVMRMLDDF